MEIHLNAYAAVIILVVFIIAMITIIVFRLELKKLRNIYSLRMKKVPLNDQDKVEPYVMAADVYAVPPSSWAERLDVVYRIGRMDVQGWVRIYIGIPKARKNAVAGSLHLSKMARIHDKVQVF
ncbi:hypothetical protein [Trichococcus sp.]|uniref:hypothetical protein n=1 Tax=Trichococcus sp. TaxID=1985464 RepID=UPI003C7A5F63